MLHFLVLTEFSSVRLVSWQPSVSSCFLSDSKILFKQLIEGPEGVKWELGFSFFCTLKMGFTALRLGFEHCERKKRFLQWELDFFPFTILFDTIAQMCLFKLKEIKFCTTRPQ